MTSTDDTEKRITRTEAKTTYFLKDADLECLTCELKKSRQYRNTIMKLYVLSEIKVLAYRIWGGPEGVAAEKERRLKRKAELSEKRMAKYHARKQELANALSKYGLKIRKDSKLCAAYLDGGKYSLKYVVDTCRKMNWLYAKTDYASRLHEVIQQEYEILGHCDTQDEAEDMQSIIIEEHGGGEPWTKY